MYVLNAPTAYANRNNSYKINNNINEKMFRQLNVGSDDGLEVDGFAVVGSAVCGLLRSIGILLLFNPTPVAFHQSNEDTNPRVKSNRPNPRPTYHPSEVEGPRLRRILDDRSAFVNPSN